MSNDVYGYVLPRDGATGVAEALREAAHRCSLGVTFPSDVHGLAEPAGALLYRLTDGPEKTTAEYLVDMEDYAHGATIGLPLTGEDRLTLLARWVEGVAHSGLVRGIMVAVSDANTLERVFDVTLSSFGPRLLPTRVSARRLTSDTSFKPCEGVPTVARARQGRQVPGQPR